MPLWLEPAIPFASAFVLLVAGRALGRRVAAWLGTLSILAAFLIALADCRIPTPYTDIVWHWIAVGSFQPRIALYLDPLAIVMTLVVTFVSFLIHLYSTEFMRESEGYERFFAYMNLFVASMLTLVLADNLLLLLLGWEGVGLCSYLLVGFWYQDEVNGLAGRKAFIVTRVGDTAMILGLFLLFNQLGTLDIQPLMQRAAAHWHVGAAAAEVAAFLLLGGAVGKSAQLPLQTWLPDAMAGPTPTSALIHAATMVTAGVYLIARVHVLFELAPAALSAVAVIGLATLLLAGCSALVQTDIKRILAYSTISQIGYMFLALGVGAWSAAIFHLVVHAFFKALLFLAAGVVIHAMHEEHDIFQMGGLRKKLPVAFWCFVFAGCSLAGLPLITAGFYTKGQIIWSAWSSPLGSTGLWIGALIGAFLTALYIFRLIFVVFYGPERREPHYQPGWPVAYPMAILAALSLGGALFAVPRFLASEFPSLAVVRSGELVSQFVEAAVFFIGVYLVYLYRAASPPEPLRRFWFSDWGMDWLYERALVHPVIAAARADKNDIVDQAFAGIAWLSQFFHRSLSRSQTGRVRWYAGWIAGGAIVLLLMVMLR